MGVFLIGVDCATQANKTGLARAEFDGENCCLLDVKMGSKCLDPASKLCEWVKLSKDSPTLIALDAPLGWPEDFGSKLARHKAGQPIKGTCLDTFFNRKTDRIVHKEVNKCKGNKPFEVGADKIARASFVALKIIENVRRSQKGEKLDVLVSRPRNLPNRKIPSLKKGAQAIEVYPAATLRAHGYWKKGNKSYKGKSGKGEREKIVKKLSRHFRLEPETGQLPYQDKMTCKPDAMDAVACILAGLDFLNGEARGPENDLERARAEKEGWIWVRRPNEDA